jgi:hypothetical protein
MDLGGWFAQMLQELEEDDVEDVEAIENLKGRVATAFAQWRIDTGYGMGGPGTGPNR